MTATSAPFLALHALHAVPASLLNRDLDGATKAITLDGVPRVRVSSQAWKRGMRVHNRDQLLAAGAAGLRTNKLAALTAAHLAEDHGIAEERAAVLAAATLTAVGLAANPKTGNTKVTTFTANETPARIAAAIADRIDDIDGDTISDDLAAAARAALDVGECIDLALYGRMLSEIPGANIDAALAVAHPFSVAAASIEADFFTAVDDAATAADAQSNMLGTVDLSAPTLYRHAVLDRRQLLANLHAAADPQTLARQAEESVLDAWVKAFPSAKKNSTAAHTLPALVVAVVGAGAYSASDAFSPAITGRQVTHDAAARMLAQLRSIVAVTGGTTVALPINASVCRGLDFDGITVVDSLDAFTEAVR
ncbi:type I-E CRISPR-associated protein Cas7/Cse4/CasC [Dietzia sp. 179-F 9C3 NHS]|uniref:type I-E CRISPR-associated protein Cas7/Cse4/CasC n=1 Tax=Dietzia sp. 179-F 9C3 NHS TaxID=3374295 RepID=UPI0038794CBE